MHIYLSKLLEQISNFSLIFSSFSIIHFLTRRLLFLQKQLHLYLSLSTFSVYFPALFKGLIEAAILY